MGFQYEFNWILKLSSVEDNLSVGHSYTFVKDGVRTYPLGIPIDLVSSQGDVLARCIINTITLTTYNTEGKYTVIEVYSSKKKKILTEQWKSLLQTIKNIK